MRRKLVFISVLFLLIGLYSVSLGQNPGYMGKKITAGIGLEITNPVSGNLPFSPSIQLERSFTYRTSIKMGIRASTFATNYEVQSEIIQDASGALTGKDDQFNPVLWQNGLIEGDITGFITSIDFSRKKYKLGTGAIAPFGKFFEIGFRGNFIQLNESEATIPLTDGDTDYQFTLEHDTENNASFNLGLHLLIGEKRFLENARFLEYSLGVDIDGIGPRYQFFSHTNMAHSVTREHVLLPSFLKLNLIYGLAI